MGDMMGAGIGNWILWWIFLGIAMMAAAGVVAARAPGTGRKTGQPLVPSAEPPAWAPFTTRTWDLRRPIATG
jgi:hypothetical protein